LSLKTDYKDDIPRTPQRKYELINNDDGTVSLQDVTEYTQVGDTFGAGDINTITSAINSLNSEVLFTTANINNGVTSFTVPNINKYKVLLVRCGVSVNNNTTVSIPVTASASTYTTNTFLANDEFFSVSAMLGVTLNGANVVVSRRWVRGDWVNSVFRIFEIVGLT
jgi:hypothetical protein